MKDASRPTANGSPAGEVERAGSVAAALGDAIHTARAGRYTLVALATRAEISAGLLSLIERGHGNPSFTTLVRIAAALDVSPSDLVAAAMAGASDRRPEADASAGPSEGALRQDWKIDRPPDADQALVVQGAAAPVGSPWQTQMVIRDGQEASVLVREGALELSLRDVTADYVPLGADARLVVDIGMATGSGGAPVPLPSADDPRWIPVVRGQTLFRPSSLACSLLYTHVVRCTTQDPSSANVQHWIGELRGYFVAAGPERSELQELFE